jgi:hypothetical protein
MRTRFRRDVAKRFCSVCGHPSDDAEAIPVLLINCCKDCRPRVQQVWYEYDNSEHGCRRKRSVVLRELGVPTRILNSR